MILLNSVQLKKLVQIVNNTGDYNVFKLRTRRHTNNEEEIALLWQIYVLGRNTTFFDADVREHIYENATYEELHNKYETTIPSLRNKVYRQLKILDDIAPIDILNLKEDKQPAEVIATLSAEILDLYNRTENIEKTLADYFIVDLFSNRDTRKDFSDFDEEDFLFARDIYARMSLPNVHFLADNLGEDVKDYFAYLLMTPVTHLSEKDLQRRKNVTAFLRLPDNI